MGIQRKIFLAFIATNMVLIVAMFLLVRISIGQGMQELVDKRTQQELANTTLALAEIYAHNGDWSAFREHRGEFFRTLRLTGLRSFRAGARARQASMAEPDPNVAGDKDNRFVNTAAQPSPAAVGADGVRPSRALLRQPGAYHVALLDATRERVAGMPGVAARGVLVPIQVNNRTAGFLAIPHRARLPDDIETAFVDRQKHVYSWITLAMIVASLGVTLLLANHFVRPLQLMSRHMRQLTRGRFGVKLDARSGDEFGDLARDFNELVTVLEANDEARKHWLADVSRNFAEPLVRVREKLQALLKLPNVAHHDRMLEVHQDIVNLNKSIASLQNLSDADLDSLTYHKDHLSLADLLRQKVNQVRPLFTARNHILSLDCHHDSTRIWGDQTRLYQLFDYILRQCRKASRDGGQTLIRVERKAGNISVRIENSTLQLTEQECFFLFDRSTHCYDVTHIHEIRLQLSICKKIVCAHGGDIWVKPSVLGGVCFTLAFPASQVAEPEPTLLTAEK